MGPAQLLQLLRQSEPQLPCPSSEYLGIVELIITLFLTTVLRIEELVIVQYR